MGLGKLLKRSALAAFALIATGVAFFGGSTRESQVQFRREWIGKLGKCRTIAEVKAIGKPAIGELDVRTFKDGSWIAVAWHCSHDDGGEWDQDVFLDNMRHIYWSNHHFCGYEGLCGEFLDPDGVPATTAASYFKTVTYKLVRVR